MPEPTLVDLATQLPTPVTVGAMFGKPTLKDPAGKAFACLFNGDLACRLGRDTDPYQAALSLEGARLFDPSARDRPMKDWVVIPANHSARWPEFASAALSTPR
jgi:hypothetical protein